VVELIGLEGIARCFDEARALRHVGAVIERALKG